LNSFCENFGTAIKLHITSFTNIAIFVSYGKETDNRMK